MILGYYKTQCCCSTESTNCTNATASTTALCWYCECAAVCQSTYFEPVREFGEALRQWSLQNAEKSRQVARLLPPRSLKLRHLPTRRQHFLRRPRGAVPARQSFYQGAF